MSKVAKQRKQLLKKKLQENKGRKITEVLKKNNLDDEAIKNLKGNSMVTVEVKKNYIAKVDRNNIFADTEEVKEIINDLFRTNTEIKEGKYIDIYRMCDVCYSLTVEKINKMGNITETLFTLC